MYCVDINNIAILCYLQEIEEICSNVVERNAYRGMLYSKRQAFDAWRQVVEVILTACSEDLLQGEPRQSVIFELLQDLLVKVRNIKTYWSR